MSDYRLSEDPTELDMDRVVRWISVDAYWAKGRTREVVERSFANSFLVGLYAPHRQQVAVARSYPIARLSPGCATYTSTLATVATASAPCSRTDR